MPPEDRHSGVLGGNGSGADIKSGFEADMPDGTGRDVTFGTAFASTPRVTVSFAQTIGGVDIVSATDVTTTGFRVHVYKGHGGAGHTWDVQWIATDAGDP